MRISQEVGRFEERPKIP